MKKILAIILLVVLVTGLFCGCTQEMVQVIEKESTYWMTTVITNGSVICVPHHGWKYKGINSDGEEISWRSVQSFEIGEEVAVIH